jgi:F-type H+-transporting ATPase subunit b
VNLLTTVAEAAGGNVFDALGIDWQTLLFQIVGFIVLVFVMMKWVYPILIKSVDERQRKIEEGLRAARDAEDNAAKVQAEIDEKLSEARKTARDIVVTAKEESQNMLAEADKKAKIQAKRTLDSTREEIAKEIEAAKRGLESTVVELVADATSKVVEKTYSVKDDQKVIVDALKEAR